MLLTGHGVALGDSSLYRLVKRVYDLRVNALIQQQAILLGGDITYLEGQAADVSAEATNGSGNRPAATRFWEYWRRQISLQ